MTKDQIRTIFMQRGFTIKEGQDDLKDYVYEAANDLIRARDEEARALLADGGKGDETESTCNPADICAGCRCKYSRHFRR
jgi:hypothetical protein